MSTQNEFVAYILDQLADFDQVAPRRMFGGHGLFHRGVMIALIADDRLYFKVDDRNRPDFEAAGMAPFSYETSSGTRGLASYYEAPPDAMENPDELVRWARGAADAALAADRAKPPSRRRSK